MENNFSCFITFLEIFVNFLIVAAANAFLFIISRFSIIPQSAQIRESAADSSTELKPAIAGDEEQP